MSCGWDIGFRETPNLDDLDKFMESLGFKVDPEGHIKNTNFTRVYDFFNPKLAPREIKFFYDVDSSGKKLGNEKIRAYGSLITYNTEPTHVGIDARANVIMEKGVKTELDWYKHVTPEYLVWYVTALALKDRFTAVVISEQTGEEIDQNKVIVK